MHLQNTCLLDGILFANKNSQFNIHAVELNEHIMQIYTTHVGNGADMFFCYWGKHKNNAHPPTSSVAPTPLYFLNVPAKVIEDIFFFYSSCAEQKKRSLTSVDFCKWGAEIH